MGKLSLKQQIFADEYIITGNSYQSAIKAGYSERYSKGNSYKLVENSGIKSYIEKRLSELKKERTLTMEEALELTSSIARGVPQRFVTRSKDPKTGDVLEEEVNEFSASFKERNQALEHFYKINAAFIDKQQLEVSEVPTFIDDISGDDDG
ncbi:terminase small subunit [Brochothrix thermosphacta]|uniref:terminase small subunit n=1 Tax=Brochothrix thermosphacta TaxID=2756 RepID=UPI001C4F1441|nr:terminase small subunit [Brochothrix thermosphacta]